MAASPPESRASAVIIVDDCSGVADLALCNDKNTCTTDDRCKGGLCVGIPAADGTACTDGNQCTRADLCNQGVCAGSPVPEGTACTDLDPCTANDSCRSGLCTPGAPAICDDGLACTVDTCAAGIGCQFQAIPGCTVPDGGAPVDVGPASDGVAQPDAGAPGDGGPADTAGIDLPDGSADAADADDSGDLTISVDRADESTLPEGGDVEDFTPTDGSQDSDFDGSQEGNDDGSAPDGSAPDGSASDGSTPVFKARGGACSCELAAPPSTGRAAGTVLLIALCFSRRRRSRAAKPP